MCRDGIPPKNCAAVIILALSSEVFSNQCPRLRGVGSLSQGFQAKKSVIRQVGFVPPALPLCRGRDVKEALKLRAVTHPHHAWYCARSECTINHPCVTDVSRLEKRSHVLRTKGNQWHCVKCGKICQRQPRRGCGR